ATVLAVVATDLAGPIRSLPVTPEHDQMGLTMEIIFAEPDAADKCSLDKISRPVHLPRAVSISLSN
ncbi:hypothetical protein MJD09_25990, partial [bacterium]|nr:hypothetical protein [bacterium]